MGWRQDNLNVEDYIFNRQRQERQGIMIQLNIRGPGQQFHNRPVTQITPNRNRAPTPIRLTSINGQEPHNKSNPPNKSDIPTRKPMISPARTHAFYSGFEPNQLQRSREYGSRGSSVLESSVGEKCCKNHPNKHAEFMIDIEDESMMYCERCAAQLASQGFEVHKIENSTVKKGDYNEKRPQTTNNSLPQYPEYQHIPMYQTIIHFLKELSVIQNEHHENMNRLANIDDHYKKQILLTENFYEELLNTIETMKEDHLNDIMAESRRHSQIADIERDYLRENVDQMEYIRKDIEDNLETILEKVEEEELEINLNQYRQKIQVFRHKVQDQGQIFEELINYSEQQLDSKSNLIQNYLLDVWDEKPNKPVQKHQERSGFSNPLQNKENIIHNFPEQKQKPLIHPPTNLLNKPSGMVQMKGPFQPHHKKTHSERTSANPAFRKLFDEDEAAGSTSPQFKKM